MSVSDNFRCGICGGMMVEIRGQYPKEARRIVCPTCLAECMDRIHEESGREYGTSSQDSAPDLKSPGES